MIASFPAPLPHPETFEYSGSSNLSGHLRSMQSQVYQSVRKYVVTDLAILIDLLSLQYF